MQNAIYNILTEMAQYLSISELQELQRCLIKKLSTNKIGEKEKSNEEYVSIFLNAKRLEGCTGQTLAYYERTLNHFIKQISVPIMEIDSEDIREYLSSYQKQRGCSKATLDNIRRNLSSFFSWLEDEDYILKSPFRKIHKIKKPKKVKQPLSEEMLTNLIDGSPTLRDRAMIDMLYSTGIRVGELVALNRVDIDMVNRECKVFGKGEKERIVYFTSSTKVHLQQYLDSRRDNNEALFVTLDSPFNRLCIGAVEHRVKILGRRLGINNVHPHRFRTTMATHALAKGMKIEQVQHLLGHNQIDTTLQYALVDDEDVKNAHKKLM